MNKELMKGELCVVTGAAAGIGRAIALRLSEDGYMILLHGSRPSDKLTEVKELIEQRGGKAEILTADLCDLRQTEALCGKIGDVDALVLNASLQIREGWRDITLDECERQLNCNFVSSLMLIQAAVPICWYIRRARRRRPIWRSRSRSSSRRTA